MPQLVIFGSDSRQLHIDTWVVPPAAEFFKLKHNANSDQLDDLRDKRRELAETPANIVSEDKASDLPKNPYSWP